MDEQFGFYLKFKAQFTNLCFVHFFKFPSVPFNVFSNVRTALIPYVKTNIHIELRTRKKQIPFLFHFVQKYNGRFVSPNKIYLPRKF